MWSDGEPADSDISDSSAPAADNDEPTAAASDEPAAPAVDADAATDVAEAPAEEVANAAPAANPNLLELTFNEQSWTEIFDANNQRVFVGLQTPAPPRALRANRLSFNRRQRHRCRTALPR